MDQHRPKVPACRHCARELGACAQALVEQGLVAVEVADGGLELVDLRARD